ncbi:MAG: VOC family protein [Pseudomonadota bacterium]|nr:VOC family protein [Pseudomonadota bacterium]
MIRQFKKTFSAPSSLGRREFLQMIPLLVAAPSALAQDTGPVAVQKIHSCDMRVTDVARSVQFYQDLFGAPVQARRGEQVFLRVGDGPRFFSLSPTLPGQEPGFSHIGLSVAGFDAEQIQAQLERFGIARGVAPTRGQSRLSVASTSWLEQQGAVSELFFADREGLIYHLMGDNYCGGNDADGGRCETLEQSATDGMFSLIDYSHFTNFLTNRARANAFYTEAFGKTFQAYQGPGAPVIGVGDGLQFLMYVGGEEDSVPAVPGRIDHVCFSVEDFDVDRILARLTDYGLKPRENPRETAPLMHWISMRMPNRGGAEGGTPELYFTDPDGLRIQLQDRSYCGGTGYLGDICAQL